MPESKLGKARDLRICVAGFTFRYSTKGIIVVDLVEIVPAGIPPYELHIDQAAQHAAAGQAGHVGLQQVVDRSWDYRIAVDGQRLHNGLCGGVEAAESFADQDLHDLLGQEPPRIREEV